MPPKKKNNEKEENSAYVKVDSPLSIRREILESAIESAELLKSWESYQSYKYKKLEVVGKVVNIMRRIEKEVIALKKRLPVVDVPELEEEKLKPVKVTKRKVEKVVDNRPQIDKEIDSLQERINKLN
jgi:hypothetical protein